MASEVVVPELIAVADGPTAKADQPLRLAVFPGYLDK